MREPPQPRRRSYIQVPPLFRSYGRRCRARAAATQFGDHHASPRLITTPAVVTFGCVPLARPSGPSLLCPHRRPPADTVGRHTVSLLEPVSLPRPPPPLPFLPAFPSHFFRPAHALPTTANTLPTNHGARHPPVARRRGAGGGHRGGGGGFPPRRRRRRRPLVLPEPPRVDVVQLVPHWRHQRGVEELPWSVPPRPRPQELSGGAVPPGTVDPVCLLQEQSLGRLFAA